MKRGGQEGHTKGSDIRQDITVLLDDGAGHDADIEFGGESTIAVEIGLEGGAEAGEGWVGGDPGC
jgi:hypothetical protein